MRAMVEDASDKTMLEGLIFPPHDWIKINGRIYVLYIDINRDHDAVLSYHSMVLLLHKLD